MNKSIFILLLLPLILAFSPPATPTEKGISAFSAGKYDEAADNFERAAKDNPDKPEAHINLGDALYKKGEYDRAAREYEGAARLNPKMPEAWYNMGDALYRMGAYDKALEAFKKADALKKEADTKHNIAVTLEKVKEEKKQGLGAGGQGLAGQKQNQKSGTGGQQAKNQNQGQENQGQNQGGQSQGLSESDISKMLARQREEEKNLRNYFHPGKKDSASDREAQIEQILRSMGAPAPSARPPRPGAPYIEKDW